MPVIRRAVPDDLPTLLPLCREFCEIDRHPFDRVRIERALRPLLTDDRYGQVWLIQDLAAARPTVVGYGVVTWGYSLESGGRDALLDELYLRERGRGLGSAAAAEMVAEAAAAGAARVFLETEAGNDRARGFYRRLGFAVEDSVWMSRDLP